MYGFMRRFRRGFRYGLRPQGEPVTLDQLEAGQSGTVIQIQGGQGMINRLNARGIRDGKRITKVGSMGMRGPVTVQVDRAQVAIGFGMARRIVIELDLGKMR